MIKCKICEKLFNSDNRQPYILKCGHTFCKICIDKNFFKYKYFSCLNCFYVCLNINDLILNHIITDRSSYAGKKNKNIDNSSDLYYERSIFLTNNFKSKQPEMIEDLFNNGSKDNNGLLKEKIVAKSNRINSFNWKQCKMRFCEANAEFNDICLRCQRGLQNIDRLYPLDIGEVEIYKNNDNNTKTPKKALNKPKMNLIVSRNNTASLIRPLNKNLSTVKKLNINNNKSKKICHNEGCYKAINKAEKSQKYCGYVCRNKSEFDQINMLKKK